MAFKDIWKDLQDATEGIAGSGDDISVEPINTIAHAVIDNETNLVGKVDKVVGKGLSTNDLTDVLLERLNNQTFDGIIKSQQEGIYSEWMPPDIDNLDTGIYRVIDLSDSSGTYAYHYILFVSREDGSGYRVLFGNTYIKYAFENSNGWDDWQYLSFINVKEHLASKQNPHSVTKAQIGLENVDNTSDLNKPISTAVQTALDAKADKTEVVENDNALKLAITALKEKSLPHTTASGYPISLTDHLNDEQVIDYKIYGNSTQDGTPSTDSPVEIQSVGDLVTDTASEYYGKYAVPVKVSGKNLFKYVTADRVNASLVEDIFDDNGNKIGAVLQGASSTNPGAANYVNGWFRPGNLPNSNTICPKLYTGQTVTVSVDYKILEAHKNFNGQVGLYLMSRNSSDAYTTGTKSVTAGNQYRLSHTFTITTKETYEWYPVVTINSCKVEVKNFQIEFGTANTDYEPYQEPVTTNIYLNEPLRKIGDCADYIDYKNQNVVRQIEVLDDTGTKTIDESLGLLAEPTTETINVPDLITPDSGVANISASTSTQPSGMDVTYYQDINKIITELKNAILAQGGNV